MPEFRIMRRYCDFSDKPENWHVLDVRQTGSEAAEVVTRLKAAHGSLYVYRIKRIDDDALWREREQYKFDSGDYEPTPWHGQDWYKAKHNDHFCHLSLSHPGKVAYTENAAKGCEDRQTTVLPGRYLTKHFKDVLSADEIEQWASEVAVLAGTVTLKVTQDADEIETIYVNGPQSCMSSEADDYSGPCHPARVYAGPDLAVAYVGTLDEPSGRCVVWPEKKAYYSLYGDCSRMRLLLKEAGYTERRLDGARVRRIPAGGSFVMPYVDGIGYCRDAGDYIILGEGDHGCQSTEGLCEDIGSFCGNCGEHYDEEEGSWLEEISEVWCDNCVAENSTYCELSDEHLLNSWHEFVAVHSVMGWGRVGGVAVVTAAIDHPDVVHHEETDTYWAQDVLDFCQAVEAFALSFGCPELPLAA